MTAASFALSAFGCAGGWGGHLPDLAPIRRTWLASPPRGQRKTRKDRRRAFANGDRKAFNL